MGVSAARPHPLLTMLLSAADGVFPPADGRLVFAPPPRAGLAAVVSFTGHAVLASTFGVEDFEDLDLDGYGSALGPEVLRRLAGPRGCVGVVDVTLTARGSGSPRLPRRSDLDGHPRVQHARRIRDDVRVYGDERGLVTLARGLAGRLEVSVEASPRSRQGTGRELIADALRLVPSGAPVFAAVSPGNARSLRAFLATGFVPIGSEILIRTASGTA